jgi:hypothetical protein
LTNCRSRSVSIDARFNTQSSKDCSRLLCNNICHNRKSLPTRSPCRRGRGGSPGFRGRSR